ncbi:MAG: hypothetical protein ACM34H_03440 [Deltaproteobacteria bacterium]
MKEPKVFFSLPDNGGRRTSIDRRKFSYSAHIPERRQGIDRRSGCDRRELISLKQGHARKQLSGGFGKAGRRTERRIALKRLPPAEGLPTPPRPIDFSPFL